MIGKRLINTGVAAADALVPSENFNTVLYTGNGSTQRIGGYINRGGVFNGSSSEIEVSSSVLNINTISIFAWINLSTTSGFQQIVSNYSSSNTGWGLRINNGGYLSYNTAVAVITGTTILSTNTWYHVGVTIDSSGNSTKLYINGQEEGSTTYTAATYGSGNTNFHIGSLGNLNTQYFNGKIDQVRVFNKALSSGEVTTLYGETYASSTVSTTDIFSDGSGVALYQLDGNANDTGGVSGKFGSAAIFNGTNSYIQVGTGLDFNSSDCAISFWIKFNDSTVASQTTAIAPNGGSGFYELGQSGSTVYWIWCTQNFGSFTTPSTGVWHHIVMTVTGNTSTIYVDGVSTDTDTSTFTSADSGLTLGAKRDAGSRYFNGSLDEIRIYSDALTSTEVGYLYNNTTASIPTDNLEAYYKFDGDARDEQQLYDGTATNVTYAYDGTATNVTYQEATNFQPDLVWIKGRVQAQHSGVFDSVRGADLWLRSGTTDAENNFGGGYGVTSFDSNGFTIGSGSAINNNGDGNVAWCFKGGGTAVSNTDGSITSSVSANQDAGFSICSWNTQSSNGTYTIGHGLSSAPELIINKDRDSSSNWVVWSSEFSTPANDFMYLNSASAKNSSTDSGSVITSTTFNTKTGHDFLTNKNIVSYCFHSVDGYSKVGSYTGTGTTNGNFVETGFEPAFVMVKRTDGGAQNWVMFDNKRSTTNPRTKKLAANLSSDENNSGTIGTDAQDNLDFYADGFRPVTSNNHTNISGGTFIYLAIAADPDTTTPTVEDSFDVVTYTGNGTDITVNTDFKPDMVWIKERTSTSAPRIVDSVRGDKKRIFTNTTDAESTVAAGEVFLENGFQIGADNGSNQNGEDYVAWVWKAGDHDDNLPQINTEGSIDSVVSVNAEAGFSIVKYTTPTTNNFSVGHGLSSAPELVFFKGLNQADNWITYASTTGATKYLRLNGTDAATTSSLPFNDTSPTSTVINLGSASTFWGTSIDTIAYCFHSVSGYQKIGSYTGTGATGNVINVGFKPRFLMWKKTNGAVGWFLLDGVRNTTDVWSARLEANNSGAEAGPDSYTVTVSNTGFEMTGSFATWTGSNELNSTYIYLAIK